ncbi:MAG: gliding motility-associated C-terminal domain-containing protein [Flavobacteriales bacterium]|nr:gliding motility-associated C-terminal domain-containing protein [Flavobacteriales bacterium]
MYCIELIASSANGCTDIERKCVKVYNEFFVFIPNTFTPNDDGHNDIFYVQGYGIKKIEMTIFDRWGREVFYSDNQLAGWNGNQLDSQKPLLTGVYVYKVTVTDFKNIENDYFGKVNLIR